MKLLLHKAIKTFREFFLKKTKKKPFNQQGSKGYWETRYALGGNSGGGSYGRLAEFKAEILNNLIAKYRVGTVIELGCGDGNQTTLLTSLDHEERYYLGLDVSPTAITHNLEKFKVDEKKDFLLFDSTTLKNIGAFLRADMTLSLDVLYHLVERPIYESYLNTLFDMSSNYVVIYASDDDSIKTNAPHVLIRSFTPYIKEHFKDFELIEKIENKYHWDGVSKSDTNEWSWSDFFVYRRVLSDSRDQKRI